MNCCFFVVFVFILGFIVGVLFGFSVEKFYNVIGRYI